MPFYLTDFEPSTKFLIILILSLTPQSAYAQIDGIYCGEETCYDGKFRNQYTII